MAVSDGSGNCCSCGQYANCSCSGIACSITCRSKAEIAELCGFEEFTSPSSPPKKYRRRRVTGEMNFARYSDADCGGQVAIPASVECRSKEGTATLEGISEYTSPSSPPKKYRTQTIGGTLDICIHTSGTCATQLGQAFDTYSGAYSIDRLTLAVTNTQQRERHGTPVGGPANCASAVFQSLTTGLSQAGWASGSLAVQPNFIRTIGPTSDSYAGNNVCGFANRIATGNAQATLSEEDTEADAVERALAAIGSWDSSGTCDDHTSFIELRASGFSLDFRMAQTRVVISGGLTSGQSYEIRIKLERRNHSLGGAYTPAGADILLPFTASGTSHTTDWEDLPNLVGLEYRVAGVEVWGVLEQLTEDEWDVTDQYNASTCALTSDEGSSLRVVDGEPATGEFNENPGDVYGAGVDVVTEPAERTYTGKEECLPDGAGDYLKHTGTVTETLNDEDNDEDAEDRAAAALDWDGPGACNVRSAFRVQRVSEFTFGFRRTQVKVQWTAVNGVSYTVKTRFARRVLGSSGPYLFYALDERTILADVTGTEETDWIDVPNDAGWETIAANCSVEPT